MEIERVQRWVLSGVIATTSLVFAGGIALLSAVSVQAGARPGLLTMSVIVGIGGMVGVRVVSQKSPLTPWLLAGVVPAVLGWYLTR